MAKGEKNSTVDSCLEDKKVMFKFIPRMRGGITDNPKHVAYGGMLDTAFREFVPGCTSNGIMKQILTSDEQEFLEKALMLKEGTLSIYNKEYWKDIKVRLYKNNNVFDLKDPMQYIRVKVLLSNDSLICNSLEGSKNKRTYMFYKEVEGEDVQRKASKLNSTMLVYKLYGKYEDDLETLRYVLKTIGKITKRSIKLEDARNAMAEPITSQTEKVIEVLGDKLLKTKVLLHRCLEQGLLILKKNEIYSKDGKKFADGNASRIQDCAEFLSEPINQEKKFALEAELKKN